MKLNPYLNAALAAVYIILIVFVMNLMASLGKEGEDLLILPIAMLSLFVLSTAVMGFLFIYEPLRLFMDNKKNEALGYFLKTVLTFAAFAAFFVATWIIIAN